MSIKSRIDVIHKMFRTTKQFERIFEKISITKLENGRCLAEFKVEEEHVNFMGGLHGGLSATLVDSLSSYALHSLGSEPKVNHVSVDIHMSYLKGAKIGDNIEVDAYTVKAGKSLSFLEVLIRNKDTGDVLVKGSHTKYMLR